MSFIQWIMTHELHKIWMKIGFSWMNFIEENFGNDVGIHNT